MKSVILKPVTGLLIGLLPVVGLFAQNKPNDVSGWEKIKWGMTVAEAKAASPKTVAVENFVMEVSLCGATCEAAKTLDTELVTVVILSLDNEKVQYFEVAYETLKFDMIRKYGKPTSETRTRSEFSVDTKATWIFPSTTIVMLYSRFSTNEIVAISYHYVDKDKDTL